MYIVKSRTFQGERRMHALSLESASSIISLNYATFRLHTFQYPSEFDFELY